jgi:hypothetical protein
MCRTHLQAEVDQLLCLELLQEPCWYCMQQLTGHVP